jgi:hypothetical protein
MSLCKKLPRSLHFVGARVLNNYYSQVLADNTILKEIYSASVVKQSFKLNVVLCSCPDNSRSEIQTISIMSRHYAHLIVFNKIEVCLNSFNKILF